MVFAPKTPKFPKFDNEETSLSPIAFRGEEEEQTHAHEESVYDFPEKQVDAFESLRHSFRPKDDFSEKMQTLVKNMAEPMIRNWLEKHMMGIVESLVRDEIERATRGK